MLALLSSGTAKLAKLVVTAVTHEAPAPRPELSQLRLLLLAVICKVKPFRQWAADWPGCSRFVTKSIGCLPVFVWLFGDKYTIIILYSI